MHNYFIATALDGKYISKFYKNIDVIAINGNIAEHNKNFFQKVIQNYNFKFIIDPMTYILQSKKKSIINEKGEIKKSILKIFENFYNFPKESIKNLLNADENEEIFNVITNMDIEVQSLVNNIRKYQENFIIRKDLGAFNSAASFGLKFVTLPYLDNIKKTDAIINKNIINFGKKGDMLPILISENSNLDIIESIIKDLNKSKISTVQIWIANDRKKEMNTIMEILKKIKKNMLFKFIDFSSIHKLKSNNFDNIEGFMTAFGYGEGRNVYPLGGGLPVNKVYSKLSRKRIKVQEYFREAENEGVDFLNKDTYKTYLENICNCSICNNLIEKSGLESISLFASSKKYNRKLKNGSTSARVMASQDAIILTTMHYIEIKLEEYKDYSNGYDTKWYKKWNKDKK